METLEIDEIALNELRLFIDNDYELYKGQTLAIIANLKRKIDNGSFLPERAPLLLMYIVDNGARKYCKMFGGNVKDMFPKPLRFELAKQMAEHYESEIRLGNYN